MSRYVADQIMDTMLNSLKAGGANEIDNLFPCNGDPNDYTQVTNQTVVTNGAQSIGPYTITNSPENGGIDGRMLVYDGVAGLTVNAATGSETVDTVAYTGGTTLLVKADVASPPTVQNTDQLTVGTCNHTIRDVT